ncbi:hypothetical protein PENTCL1PPCAC_25314, partial [Pristionchus entomophagus]
IFEHVISIATNILLIADPNRYNVIHNSASFICMLLHDQISDYAKTVLNVLSQREELVAVLWRHMFNAPLSNVVRLVCYLLNLD